ncbi:MAG: calcium/sodium antiporter [Gammaproteobacteria bacterium]|jgi:cation:H+ antiporter
MLLDIIYTVCGFALLIWGADRFVIGAEATASALGVPPLLIGLTIVGFATSAPEIMVSISAASEGLTPMAVGNAVGSNIANVGLVLGAAAMIQPITSSASVTLRKELPILILLTPATLLLFLDQRIDRMDATILLGALALFIFWMTRLGLRMGAEKDPIVAELVNEIPAGISIGKAGIWLAVGFAALLAGAELLVSGAASLAIHFGVSNLVIGLTVIAIGTSLPELAVSVVSAIKGDAGIAVGNVIGSNVFNLLAVVGVAGWISPADLDPSLLYLHYPVMIGFTLPLLLIAYNPFGNNGLSRLAGFLLVAAFLAYEALVISGSL